VDGLEIKQPARQLRIVLARGNRPSIRLLEEGKPTAPATPAVLIKAPMAGYFWGHHPLRPPVANNDRQIVTLAEILGFIRVGPILLPVKANQPGILTKCFAAHGAMVGFGDSLFEIEPYP